MLKCINHYCSILLLCFAGTLSAAEEVVIFGDNNYQPVIFSDAQGHSAGILPQLLRQFARDSGAAITIKLYPWKRAYFSAEKGLGGVIGLSRTNQRMAIFDYSAPIYDDSISVIVIKGHAFPFNALADLAGKKIGVQSGASYGSEVDAAIKAGDLTVEADQSHTSRLKKLLHGRIDAAFIGNGERGLQNLLDSDEQLAANREQFVILPRPLTNDLLYLGFAKSMHMQAFLQRFNTWLAEAQKNRSIEGISSMPAVESAD